MLQTKPFTASEGNRKSLSGVEWSAGDVSQLFILPNAQTFHAREESQDDPHSVNGSGKHHKDCH